MEKIKVAVLGDVAYGKTTFCIRAQTDDFRAERHANVAVEMFPVKHSCSGTDANIVFQDLPGEHDRLNLNKNYVTSSDLCLIFIKPALENEKEKENPEKYFSEWISKILDFKLLPIILVGSFADHFSEDSYPIDMEKLKTKFANKGVVGSYIISSKTGKNISELLDGIILNYNPDKDSGKDLDHPSPHPKKNECC